MYLFEHKKLHIILEEKKIMMSNCDWEKKIFSLHFLSVAKKKDSLKIYETKKVLF